ncbi:hypothetical protein EUGRSUZ_G02414 [Eucalyptus grandis]|uniref:Uncharacterized protein n=2 Tax=Eucalyptus grandis TaxID=71139 RepID=A0ACC3K7A0_EUCGR|nr:hypothetical protein EUGRSUZ_G02414 [Eucalyptus grandis]
MTREQMQALASGLETSRGAVRVGGQDRLGQAGGGRVRGGAGWLRGPGGRPGEGREGVGPAGADTGPPGRGRVPEPLRVELGPGGGGGGEAGGGVADGGGPVRERAAAGGGHGSGGQGVRGDVHGAGRRRAGQGDRGFDEGGLAGAGEGAGAEEEGAGGGGARWRELLERLGRTREGVGPTAKAMICNHHWPFTVAYTNDEIQTPESLEKAIVEFALEDYNLARSYVWLLLEK